ncbi:hypothetical protein [Streptomyces sp. NBC_00083]|uniref:hypothetical protein n=1 Tax=Streptomyces sp. NBC_00083 TaxID=2975647 RepID=UPI002257894D|nr:hypothetical protein [Streptomyces sp. NBC_00083]MCX5384093.1 hypothetical protein [Streptomyces sp. NBC_00083]
MNRRHTGRTGLSRLAVLCAVLFGLFSMHGAPASAAAGCHGEAALPAPMAVPPDMGHAPMSAPTDGTDGTAVAGVSAVRAGLPGHRVAPVAAGATGELCVSTPARERLPLAATGLLALLGLVVLVGRGLAGPRTALRAARRGPPLGGRGLLLQVCVART